MVNGTTGLRGLSIINNDGLDPVAGTTNGTVITSSSGQSYKVSYTGGTGNDVVLTRQNVALMLTNRTVTTNVVEGQPVVLSATIVDPDALDQFFMTVDWGDGLVTNHQFKPTDSRNIALTHRYNDDGDYQIRMVWTDPSKAGNSGALQMTVVNAAPVFDAGGSATVAARSLFERTVRFTDQSSDAAFVTVDYGDGTALQHLTPGKARSFVLQHRFSRVGSFTVNVTIDDGDGGIVSDSFVVVVT